MSDQSGFLHGNVWGLFLAGHNAVSCYNSYIQAFFFGWNKQFTWNHGISFYNIWLVVFFTTPLKNMSSSIGMMTEIPNIWENKIDGNHSPPTSMLLSCSARQPAEAATRRRSSPPEALALTLRHRFTRKHRILQYGDFLKWGYPQMDGFIRENPTKMDDN